VRASPPSMPTPCARAAVTVLLAALLAAAPPPPACPLRGDPSSDPGLAAVAQAPQPFLSVCVAHSSLACCTAAEDSALQGLMPPWVPTDGGDCERAFRAALCGARCDPAQAAFANATAITLCRPFCTALYNLCPIGHGHASPTELCEQGLVAPLGVATVAVGNSSCFGPCPDNCKAVSGRGRCVDGACVCEPAYTGASCEDIRCPNDCSGHGRCDGASGKCECVAGYVFENCSGLACPGAALAPVIAISAAEAAEVAAAATDSGGFDFTNFCSRNGVCDFSTGRCGGSDGRGKCNLWYRGDDCSQFICPNNCSGHGVCRDPWHAAHYRHDHGMCFCDTGYALDDCSGLTCPNDCSQHGICDHSDGSCTCDSGMQPDGGGGYHTADCSQRDCGLCSANAFCNQRTGNCTCVSGFTGTNCTMRDCPGGGDCNRNGRCAPDHVTLNSTCFCHEGFGGSGCGEPRCTPTLAPPHPLGSNLSVAVSPALPSSSSSSSALPREVCGLAAGVDGTLSCCDAGQADAAAALLRWLVPRRYPGLCPTFWGVLICRLFCSSEQGRYMRWGHGNVSVPLLPVLRGPPKETDRLAEADATSSSSSSSWASGPEPEPEPAPEPEPGPQVAPEPEPADPSPLSLVANRSCTAMATTNTLVTCCAAVARTIDGTVREPACLMSLLPLLYGAHCRNESVLLCANFSSVALEVCGDEEMAFGAVPRITFRSGLDFVRSLLPTQLASALTVRSVAANVSRSCIAPVQRTPTPAPAPRAVLCEDHPNWRSSAGSSCADYARLRLCTASGGYGPGWGPDWGTFADFANATGSSAAAACCDCGGGTRSLSPEPEPDPERPCLDYFDVVGGYGRCATLLQLGMSCALDFAPGQQFTGGCDLTCGYGPCAPVSDVDTNRTVDWSYLPSPDGLQYGAVHEPAFPISQLVVRVCSWYCQQGMAACGSEQTSVCHINPVPWLRIELTTSACFAPCPNDCRGRGSCYNSLAQSYEPKCKCNLPYFGDDCAHKYCPAHCHSRGVCDHVTGTCSCFHGFTGTSCEREVCPGGCSGGGLCNANTGVCTCDAGRLGADCSLFVCPDACSGAGVCNATLGSCTCAVGHYGANCARRAARILELVPALGPAEGGTIVTVIGVNFVQHIAVLCQFWPIDGIITAVFVNETAVTCVAPHRGYATVVEFSTLAGGHASPNSLPFRYYTSPTLTVTAPYYGADVGGTVVVVQGRGMWPANESKSLLCQFTVGTRALRTAAEHVLLLDLPTAEEQSALRCRSPPHTAPATATVDVSLNGQQYSSSALGFMFYSTHGQIGTPRYTVATRSSCVGAGLLQARAGDTSSFSIFARDQFGDAASTTDDEFSVSFAGTAATSDLVAKVESVSAGVYTVSYVPLLSGRLSVTVTMFRYDLAGSPYGLEVLPGAPDAVKSRLSGPSLLWDASRPGEASFEPFQALLSVRDTWDNAATLSSARLLQALIRDTSSLVGTAHAFALTQRSIVFAPVNGTAVTNSSWTFRFQPHLVGAHAMAVLLDDVRVAGQLFSFTTRLARAVMVRYVNFTSDGQGLMLTFNRATDRTGADVGIDSLSVCQNAFSAVSVASFGYQPSCHWHSSTVLRVALGFGTTLNLLDDAHRFVSLKTHAILSDLRNSLPSLDTSLPIQLPSAGSIAPVAVLDAPRVVGKCSKFVLDAAASYLDDALERPLLFRWRLISGRSGYQLVHKLQISSKGTGLPRIHMLQFDLAAGQNYVFELTVISFMGVVSVPGYAYINKSAYDLPLVRIDGPALRTRSAIATVSTLRPYELRLTGDIEPSLCERVVKNASFVWTQTDHNPRLLLPRVDSPVLVLPPNTLQAGTTYKFALTAETNAGSGLSNSAEVAVIVGLAGVRAVIVGGSNRSTSSAVPMTLDGRASVDLDASAAPFEFAWTCQVDGGTRSCGSGAVGTALTAETARLGLLYLSPGVLPPGAYMFTLNASKSELYSAASVWLSVSAARSPAVTIKTELGTDGRVNADEQVVLHGLASWGPAAGVAAAGTAPQLLQYSWSAPGLDLSLATGTAAQNLVLRPGMLRPSRSYMFTLSAAPAIVDASVTAGFAQLHVQVNTPPCCGTFTVTPLQGRSIDESFTLVTAAWWDEPADLPLSRRYFAETYDTPSATITGSSTVRRLPLGASTSVSAPSPPLHLAATKVLTLVAEVSDVHGATAVRRVNVTVLPPAVWDIAGYEINGGLQGVASRALVQCDEAINSGAVEGALLLADALARLLNVDYRFYSRTQAAAAAAAQGGRRRRMRGRQLVAGQGVGSNSSHAELRQRALQMLEAAAQRVLLTTELAQSFAPVLDQLVAVPSELTVVAASTALCLARTLARAAVASGDAEAQRSAAALQSVLSHAAEARVLWARVSAGADAAHPRTLPLDAWEEAQAALRAVHGGLLTGGGIVCGAPPQLINTSLFRAAIGVSCDTNSAEAVVAASSTNTSDGASIGLGRDYSVPLGAGATFGVGAQRVLVRVPALDTDSTHNTVSVSVVVMDISRESGGLAQGATATPLSVVSPVVHVLALMPNASLSQPGGQRRTFPPFAPLVAATPRAGISGGAGGAGCVQLTLPILAGPASLARGGVPTCAAWDGAARLWDRSRCRRDTTEYVLDERGVNHTRCCCAGLDDHYAVVLLRRCAEGMDPIACLPPPPPPPPLPCPLNCSGRGVCDARRGVCSCSDGTVGGSCETAPLLGAPAQRQQQGPSEALPQCPGDCSGHGRCVPDTWAATATQRGGNWSGACLCETGYTFTTMGCDLAGGVTVEEGGAPWALVLLPAVLLLAAVAAGLWWHHRRAHERHARYLSRVAAKHADDCVVDELAEDHDAGWEWMAANRVQPKKGKELMEATLATAGTKAKATLSLSHMPPLLPRDLQALADAVASHGSRSDKSPRPNQPPMHTRTRAALRVLP
jgi:hypothetical protein